MRLSGILNPGIASLLARVRHTNTVVIADRGFPYWPSIETVDISLVDGVPTVRQVLQAILAEYHYGRAFMAQEFLEANTDETVCALRETLGAVELTFEAHEGVFKPRVPAAVGLIRTGDTTQYANIILESA